MTTPTREIKTQDSHKMTPEEPKRQTLQVNRPKKGEGRQSKVKNTNKGNVVREEPERNHVNNKGKKGYKRKDKLPFLSFLPKKKLPFVSNNDQGKDHCLTGTQSRSLEDTLRGPLGYQAVFMPAPGQSPFSPARGTTPISGQLSGCSQSESVRSSPSARSTRSV
ncbi:hypothetical protein AgCh_022495 [Apium graveolens]